MKNLPQISESELEILKVLWRIGPVTSSKIIEELTDTTEWKPKTVQTLITRLVAKGALSTNKVNGKTFIYSSNISETEYKSYANESFIKKLYSGSVKSMFASFIKENKLTKQDINELKQLLDQEE